MDRGRTANPDTEPLRQLLGCEDLQLDSPWSVPENPRGIEAQRPVCVLGMHRSGTSMATRILASCGLNVGSTANLLDGEATDNPDGYWENREIFDINERILQTFGGSWHQPPDFPDGWIHDRRLDKLRDRATQLIRAFDSDRPWGWKDPRTCLTLDFWQDLVPDLRFVLCLREPERVAESFSSRRQSYLSRSAALSLWVHYHKAALGSLVGENLIVTHYESYLYDPEAEIARLVGHLGLAATQVDIRAAAERVDSSLAHGFSSFDEESEATPGARPIYEWLQSHAGPVYRSLREDVGYHAKLESQGHVKALQRIDRLESLLEGARHEIDRVQDLLDKEMHRSLPEMLARRMVRQARSIRRKLSRNE